MIFKTKQDAIRYIIKNHFLKEDNVILSEHLFRANLIIDWIYDNIFETKAIARYIHDLERYLKGELQLDWVEKVVLTKESKTYNDYKKQEVVKKAGSKRRGFRKILSESPLFQVNTPAESPLRVLGLFGDVNEQSCAEVVQGLLVLSKQGEIPKKERKGKYTHQPIEFYVNTHGGSASDMFAIYDMMRDVEKSCEVQTVGLGKIMSAGVLLLAAGTKGKRRIGKNSRVMIHSVLGNNEGPLFNLENEINEIRFVQDKYSKALIKETKLTPHTMKKLLERRVNIYLSADEAVKYGIADEVF